MFSSGRKLIFTCGAIAGSTSIVQAEWSWFPWWSSTEQSKSGPVYVWGRTYGKHPKKLDNIPDAVSVSIRDEVGSAVTADGDVYAFDPAGGVSQVPIKSRAVSTAIRTEPQEIVILDDSGTLYKTQKTDTGFAALEQIKGALKRARIVNVSCGKSHCVAISDYGEAYSWGSNNSHGQLCVETNDKATSLDIPRKIDLPSGKRAIQGACGDRHTIILNEKGEVYAGGDDQWTQLGRDAEPWITTNKVVRDANITQAELITDLPVSDIACGAQHTAVLVRDGTMFTFGYNMYGQLGHHNYSTFAPPSPISNISLRAERIFGGGNSTCMIGKDGALKCIGAVGTTIPNMKWRHVYEMKDNGGKRVLRAISIALGGDACALIADEQE